MTISQRIFSILDSKHLSQKGLSESAGVSTAAISNWRKKGINPSSDKIKAISDFLQVSTDYLLTGEESLVRETIDYQPSLDEGERELLLLYRELPIMERGRILGIMENLVSKNNIPKQ